MNNSGAEWIQLLEAIAEDRRNGATKLAQKAASALSLCASQGIDETELKNALRLLVSGQPFMAPILRLVSDFWKAYKSNGLPEAGQVAVNWRNSLDSALKKFADQVSISNDLSDHWPWIFLSHSSIINKGLEAILRSGKSASKAIVAESRPGSEGIGTAEFIASLDWEVTLMTDFALLDRVCNSNAGTVILGCDACDGSIFVNKSGSGALACSAATAGIPVEIWTTSHKLLPPGLLDKLDWSSRQGNDLRLTNDQIRLEQPLFGPGSMKHVSLVRTEQGTFTPGQIQNLILELDRPAEPVFDL